MKPEQDTKQKMVRARVLVESYGSPREPVGKRGDIIEITRAEFESHGAGVFEDVDALLAKQIEDAKPQINSFHNQQKEAMRIEREESARMRAIQLNTEAKRAKELSDLQATKVGKL